MAGDDGCRQWTESHRRAVPNRHGTERGPHCEQQLFNRVLISSLGQLAACSAPQLSRYLLWSAATFSATLQCSR